MRQYTVSRKNVTPTAGNDLLTIIAPANKAIRIKRIRASGEATASTVMRTLIQRSTGGSGSIPLTPEKSSTTDPAASSTIVQVWLTGQPTLSGIPLYNEGWNAFGGGFDRDADAHPAVNGRDDGRRRADATTIEHDGPCGVFDGEHDVGHSADALERSDLQRGVECVWGRVRPHARREGVVPGQR